MVSGPGKCSGSHVRGVNRGCHRRTGVVGQRQARTDINGRQLIFVLDRDFTSPHHIPSLGIDNGPLPCLSRLGRHAADNLVVDANCNNKATGVRCRTLAKLSVIGFSPAVPAPCSRLIPCRGHTMSVGRLFSCDSKVRPFATGLCDHMGICHGFNFGHFCRLSNNDQLSCARGVSGDPHVSS